MNKSISILILISILISILPLTFQIPSVQAGAPTYQEIAITGIWVDSSSVGGYQAEGSDWNTPHGAATGSVDSSIFPSIIVENDGGTLTYEIMRSFVFFNMTELSDYDYDSFESAKLEIYIEDYADDYGAFELDFLCDLDGLIPQWDIGADHNTDYALTGWDWMIDDGFGGYPSSSFVVDSDQNITLNTAWISYAADEEYFGICFRISDDSEDNDPGAPAPGNTQECYVEIAGDSSGTNIPTIYINLKIDDPNLDWNFDYEDPLDGWSDSDSGTAALSEDQATFWDGNTSINFYAAGVGDYAYMYRNLGVDRLPETYHIKFAFMLDTTTYTPYLARVFNLWDRTSDVYIKIRCHEVDGEYFLQNSGRDGVYGNFWEVFHEQWVQLDLYVHTATLNYTVYINSTWATTSSLAYQEGSGAYDILYLGFSTYGDYGEFNVDSISIDEEMSGEPAFPGYADGEDSGFMGREDFESWNDMNWSESMSPEVVGAAAYEESYGLLCYAGAGSEAISINIQDDGTLETVTARFMWKWNNHTMVGGYADAHIISKIYLDLQSGSYPQFLAFGIENGDTPQDFHFELEGSFDNGIGGITQTFSGVDLDVLEDKWYYIELTLEKLNSTHVEISAFVDQAEYDTLTLACANLEDHDFLGYSFGVIQWGSSDDLECFYFDYIEMSSISYFTVSAIFEDIDDDGADWVFTDWKYYTFTVVTNIQMVNCSLMFVLDCGVENIATAFYSDSGNWVYSSNQTYETREGEPCILKSGSWDYTAPEYTVTFDIWFTSLVLDLWDPSDGVDVYGAYNSSSWFSIYEDMFRIYSKGGFTLNNAVSDDTYAWLIDGGTPFSFHVEDDGGVADQWCYNEIWWRDVQHMKLLPEVHFLTGYDEFSLTYGVDYSLGDGEWLGGWRMNINPDTVHYNGLFANEVWINMTVTFFDGDLTDIWHESLYMYPHGSLTGSGDPGWWKFWVDLWFSDKNASSVGSGRVNSYEWAMKDSCDLWLRWMANNWGVMDSELKEFQGEYPLLDGDDNIISSENIKMVRFFSNVTVYSGGGGQIIEITNFEAFDGTHSQQLPLTGVSQPVFDETVVPIVNQKGILGALWTMFANFGSFLSENVLFGGLNLWQNFVNFLDSVAAMFGSPTFFSDLFTWIAEFLGYMSTSVSYIGDIAGAFFTLFTSVLGGFLDSIVEVVNSFVTTITVFTDMMGGAYGTGADVWETLGISQWFSVAIIFYPLYLILLWDEKGMDAVIQQLTWMFGLVSWIFTFLLEIVRFVIRMITAIIESIPVVE